jgi:hypothetical protein
VSLQVLRGTGYQQMGEQLLSGFREVYGSQCSQQFLEQLRNMEASLLPQQVPPDTAQQDLKVLCAQVFKISALKFDMHVQIDRF